MKSLHIQQQTRQNVVVSSGSHHLDKQLAHGGWQSQVVNEIVSDHYDDEQLALLAPMLAKLSLQGRWIVLVGAPKKNLKMLTQQYGLDSARILLVHPKDQTDALWAMEQALMSGNASAVLGWPGTINARDLKRLQLAAKRTSALAFLFSIDHANKHDVKLHCHNNQLSQQINLSHLTNSFH
ncbi:MAG: cell division protein [Psychrobium sp.]|nr:cell division protein [Psychrobium sp.]